MRVGALCVCVGGIKNSEVYTIKGIINGEVEPCWGSLVGSIVPILPLFGSI